MSTPDTLFPFDTIRDAQKEFMQDVEQAVKNKQHLVAHAPTGLGKTAATLAPSLKEALEKDLTIFFLTSRHTQQEIVLETLKKIKEKFNITCTATSIIGKKWMCSQPGVEKLGSSEFSEFCKALREDDQCEYYLNTKKKLGITTLAEKTVSDLQLQSPCSSGLIVETAREQKLCPYEMGILLAKKAKIIIADYFYLFNPTIRDRFFNSIEKELKKSIIIIDEGHNLPGRLRDLMSAQISTGIINAALKEMQKYGFDDIREFLYDLNIILQKFGETLDLSQEKSIPKERFVKEITHLINYEEIIETLNVKADVVRDEQKRSAIGTIANFLEAWLGPEEGHARILEYKRNEKGEPIFILKNKCLDPSLIAASIINDSHATILMSGTLNPTDMFSHILGFPENTVKKSYAYPFKEKNKLSLIVPRTTTKFSMRSEEQYKNIANICAEMIDEIPGNSAVFFPSYAVKAEVAKYLETITKKSVFQEQQGMTKEEKLQLLEAFKQYKDKGAVLLGVASGSFGEGIDLPGDLLKGVIIVGLPLGRPDLETQATINYYDRKFGKGWDYGYVLPAFTKTLQNAGRCIRTETDRGVIIFLDERYSWPIYIRCFPEEWDLKISVAPAQEISNFFDDK